MTNTNATTYYLTTEEAAAVLRLARRTLEAMRLRGDGPRYRRHGRRCLYTLDDLRAWSDRRAHLSTSEAA